MTQNHHSEVVLRGQLSANPMRADGLGTDSATSPSIDNHLRLINERIGPPVPLAADDVHIRTLRLISDEVNDHGGRFPHDERLCALLIDSPVLIGHDRTRLPVARNFAAHSICEGEQQWIEVSCYWLRGPMGDRLAADIDGGVIKEGSIGFEFRRPQCSICSGDIRACEHIPGREYADSDGAVRLAHYEYREIIRVLETSLVYRGATPGTRFVGAQVFCKPDGSAITNASVADAVVLGCSPRREGLHRYLIARRDSLDPTACDESIITSRDCFGIGDRLRLAEDGWRRIEELDPTGTETRTAAACQPIPKQRVRRNSRFAIRLRQTYGSGMVPCPVKSRIRRGVLR